MKKWPKGLRARVNKIAREKEKATKNKARQTAIEAARRYVASGGNGTKPDLSK
jgi:hypothetical protein